MTTRAEAKAEVRRAILDAAREALATEGPSGIAMRPIAKRVGLVPSALYKHVADREALITELIMEAYDSLAGALESSPARWRDRAHALRGWALAHPHEFQLIYGTPVPGYQAPADTIPSATRVAAAFAACPPSSGGAPRSLQTQLRAPAGDLGVSADELASLLAALAQLVGMILLELGGHFVGMADPADHLYAFVADGQPARGTTK